MTTTSIRDQITSLVDAIYDTDYYVEIFERLCKDREHFADNPAAISILNEFWYRLPDNRAIRTPVFFQLCDVIESAAEECYNEGL